MFSITQPPQETLRFEIDGDFADWDDVQTVQFDRISTQFNPNIDITNFAAENNVDTYLSFYMEVDGQMLAGESAQPQGLVDTFHLFMDTDNAPGTGYSIDGIGANFMVEISGWNGGIVSARYSSYSLTTTQDDWNGFSSMGSAHE